MKPFYFALFIIVFSGPLSFADIQGDINFTKIYKNSAGAVTFYHQKHTERFLDECGYCHSALETFGGEVNELFAHKVCMVCHESYNGPTECNQCHDNQNTSK